MSRSTGVHSEDSVVCWCVLPSWFRCRRLSILACAIMHDGNRRLSTTKLTGRCLGTIHSNLERPRDQLLCRASRFSSLTSSFGCMANPSSDEPDALMCAPTDLWEAWVGNHPGRPGPKHASRVAFPTPRFVPIVDNLRFCLTDRRRPVFS